MKKFLISGGTIVSDGESYKGWIVVNGEEIGSIGLGEYPYEFDGETIDATGMLVLPGMIDDQVHFREPGLTYKEDIEHGSRAAVAGGITSFMEMPNTKPPTTTLEQWEWKMERAQETSLANYAFYLGATNDNLRELKRANPKAVCGIKVFMGSSTGNMLVDDERALRAVFAETGMLIATHCEDETIIRENLANWERDCPEGIPAVAHPSIRSAEACYRSSARAVELADRYGTDLHVLHLSTERELSLFDSGPLSGKKITNEICVHHLWFNERAYTRLFNLVKWNPAIKTIRDQHALQDALSNGKGDMIATDHAPHTLEEKWEPYENCPSGGPLVQHALQMVLGLVREGIITIETAVEKISHAPAERFKVKRRGFLRKGYFADIVIVDPNARQTVDKSNILYKCGWSPLEGMTFGDSVRTTFVNGYKVYDRGVFYERPLVLPLVFDR